MQSNQSSDKTINQLLPPRPPPSRRLDRPGDLKAMQLLSAYPNNNIKLVNGMLMIPIPPEDAKALGLRVPTSDDYSLRSCSTTSRSSSYSSKIVGKRLIAEDKSNKDLKHHRNVDVKTTQKVTDLKQEQKSQRSSPTSEKLSSFHAKLERGLRSISNKTKARRKVDPETAKAFDLPSNFSPAAFSGTNNNSTAKGLKKSPLSCQEGKSGRHGKELHSKSMKQLFSMTGSWSNDSMISHSDSCACCHGREPCPFHDNDPLD
ncbi:uncharacterized protein LOC143178213 [Calliopsis andreniformis]|uniref:uncharacterized protein LOC143178213 n=1 Tax=Calliopsis andreniformis TaxID=337506 RepID=UPI003FCD2008